MNRLSAWVSLFTSSGTLLCCALPSLLVALGAGATMAGLVSTFPQLVTFSRYKAWVFAFSAVMLVVAGCLQYRARNEPCPIDKDLARACMQTRRISLGIYIFAVVVWGVGAFFAFLAPYIL